MLVFYIVMQELVGDLVATYVRSKTMQLHPAMLIIAVLALAAAFGIVGALIATPLVGFIKAYYEEFWLADRRLTRTRLIRRWK